MAEPLRAGFIVEGARLVKLVGGPLAGRQAYVNKGTERIAFPIRGKWALWKDARYSQDAKNPGKFRYEKPAPKSKRKEK